MKKIIIGILNAIQLLAVISLVLVTFMYGVVEVIEYDTPTKTQTYKVF